MTRAQLQERLDAYLAAEASALRNQSYTVGSQTYTKADLRTIQAEIRVIRHELSMLELSGRFRSSTAIFGGRQ